MQHFNVTGMSCAACSARVEKAVSSVDGVKSCSVNLITNTMSVEGNVSNDKIIQAVVNAGYGASLKNNTATLNQPNQAELNTKPTKTIKLRLITSVILLCALMYISMGHVMWGWPLPPFFAGNYVGIGIAQLILTVTVMIINQKFFIAGFKGLVHRAPNMDTLVSLGSLAAFVYSTCVLFLMTLAVSKGDNNTAKHYMHEFYFESAAMILTLITVGKMLEARSKGKTTDAIKKLMALSPKTALLIKDGIEVEVPIENVKIGDVFAVKPGSTVPVDGIVIEGVSAVNESVLTGESMPIDKSEGDSVSAATVNTSGYLKCKATRVGEGTTLSQIIKMVSDAAATKAPIARIADKVSGVFVPVVMLIAAVTAAIWLFLGQTVGFSLARGISVLVISCPCALGLATPMAIMVGSGVGAKNGMLFKTAAALEMAGRVDVVVLDKTGTITMGEPMVTDILTVADVSEIEFLQYACSLEIKSEHPLGKAIVKEASNRNIIPLDVTEFESLPGNGLVGVLNGKKMYCGNFKFISQKAVVTDQLQTKAQSFASMGKTPLFFCRDGEVLGIIAVADAIKPDSIAAIKELHNLNLRVVMLTGDNQQTANAVANEVGIKEVISGVLPDGKERVVSELSQQGKVAMVGDGINDAPALTRADLGIAIGAGADIAVDAADAVLVKCDLTNVTSAIKLGRAVLKNIRQNLFWAYFYNCFGIPLAAGMWIPLLGLELNPMFGAAAMSLSSICVVTNALRLNFFKINNKSKQSKKENRKMQKTLKIEGMMCPRCEAHVKKALESLDVVLEAVANHKEGTATVTLKAEIADSVLEKIVQDAGYKVLK